MGVIKKALRDFGLGLAPVKTEGAAINNAYNSAYNNALAQAAGFGVVLSSTSHPTKPKPKPKRTITKVTRALPMNSDLGRVIHQLGLIEGQLFLAGGAVRRHIEGYGQFEGDFDIYPLTVEASVKFTDQMDKNWTRCIDGPEGTTAWKVPNLTDSRALTIQLIHYWEHASVEDCLANFDWTINQGAVVQRMMTDSYYGGTKPSYELVMSAEFERDIADRVLKPVRLRSMKSLLTRAQKFIRMGYTLPDESIQQIAQMGYARAGDSYDLNSDKTIKGEGYFDDSDAFEWGEF